MRGYLRNIAAVLIVMALYQEAGAVDLSRLLEKPTSDNVFKEIHQQAAVNGGVREITYEQFMIIRDSKQEFVLVDVLSRESFIAGHIEGAVSFPADKINRKRAEKVLPEGSKIIVYCAGPKCDASTRAAKKLMDYGYDVLDYKGGLADWQERGLRLIQGDGHKKGLLTFI
jgi:rhodanese-related sulfurtransferase